MWARETQEHFPAVRRAFPACVQPSRVWTWAELERRELPLTAPNVVDVVEQDSFDAARALGRGDEAASVLVLNMASDRHPGGGWLRDAMAQEESLFYRSTYALTLRAPAVRYPLPAQALVYSPTVVVFKDAQYRVLPWEECFTVAGVAVAALRRPALTPDGQRYAHAHARATMRRKLRALYRLAVATGHRTVVWGALGCGAFRNPAGEVAALFREVNDECTFGLRVRFAVRGGPAENLHAFRAAFAQ